MQIIKRKMSATKETTEECAEYKRVLILMGILHYARLMELSRTIQPWKPFTYACPFKNGNCEEDK